MTSVLLVDTIKNTEASGNIQIPTGYKLVAVDSGAIVAPGGIVQIKYAQKIDTGSVGLSAGTNAALHTDLEVTITPTSNNSTIKLEAQIFGEHGDAGNVYNSSVFFYRDTTKLGAAAAGSRLVGVGILPRTYTTDNADTTPEFAMYSFYDSPSTTSAITYKIGIVVRTAETFYINRTVNDGDLNYAERGVSHITATEIAQ